MFVKSFIGIIVSFKHLRSIEMDVRFHSPYSMILSGASGCGKTTWVTRFLENLSECCTERPKKIIWCYGIFQPLFIELTKRFPDIEFIEGLPENVCEQFDMEGPSLLIIDDMLEKCSEDSKISQIFTRTSHHRNISVMLLVQNIFYKGLRTISLNAHYICLFKQVRDRSQSYCLARQMFPTSVKFFTEAYLDATKLPYSYLLVDCRPQTLEDFRLRTRIFPNENTIVYVKK